MDRGVAWKSPASHCRSHSEGRKRGYRHSSKTLLRYRPGKPLTVARYPRTKTHDTGNRITLVLCFEMRAKQIESFSARYALMIDSFPYQEETAPPPYMRVSVEPSPRPTMRSDTIELARECSARQQHSSVPQPSPTC